MALNSEQSLIACLSGECLVRSIAGEVWVDNRLHSGIPALDDILGGGYLSGRTYLLRGGPGTGKTTVGLHFLSAGCQDNQTGLFITLEESEAQIKATAASLQLDLSHTAFLDLSPSVDFFSKVESYDIFNPAEVEREPLTNSIVETLESIRPQRVFIDSMTQFRYFSSDNYQFRKQVLSFLRFLRERNTTVLFTSESSLDSPDSDLQFMSDGVISLFFENGDRTLSVSKFRGSDFHSGNHFFQLTSRGMRVFPALIPDAHGHNYDVENISSGIAEIDELLDGGIERGLITIITGPSGIGKSTLGVQFMHEAAARGERSVVFAFDEAKDTLIKRCRGVGIAVDSMQEHGKLSVVQIEPLRYVPDEFAQLVQQEVEQQQARIVMLDSLSGYRLSVRGNDLVHHIHALCKYLQNMGVAVILVNEIEHITGNFQVTEAGISYLADNVIFLRYFEMEGSLRRAIGVLKKRVGDFEKQLREFKISSRGIKVGEPLTGVQGLLSGIPKLLPKKSD